MQQLDPVQICRILGGPGGGQPFPTRAERAPWQPRAATSLGREILARAAAALAEPTPALPALLYLAFGRDGAREPYETPHKARRERLTLFAIAECLEAEGRFLDAALDEIWAICEESSWVIPAHAGDYRLGLPDPELPLVDLYSATTAVALAEADWLLGAALHPAARARIRHEVARRSTLAFLARDDYPWLGHGPKKINNWMPVCAGGTAIAALYLEPDHERLAAVLARALEGIGRYLATFGDDGGTAEGVGYWEKGIFFVAALGELLAARTAGRIDLLADPRLRRIARFPARVELSPGRYPPFSDTGLQRQPQPALLQFLARRYDLPELAALDRTPPDRRRLTGRGPVEKLRDLFWYPEETAQPPAPALPPSRPPALPPAADLLPDVQWFVARAAPGDPDGLVLAAKGGHNAEPHNQNDVGSFVVHWRGESLLADLGAMRYTRDSFRAATRYGQLANRSHGHSVPLVNGCEQLPGPGGAPWTRWEHGPQGDSFLLDLAPAYPPAAGLVALERRIALCREAPHGSVELRDQALFRRAPATLASVLISLAPARLYEPGQLLLCGERGRLLVQFDAEELELRIETIPGVDLREGPRDVTRLTLSPTAPSLAPAINLRFIPLA